MAENNDKYINIRTPKEVTERPLKPGTITLRSIERVNGVFMVTFAWCDMLGVTHEKAFPRGDLFVNFDSVVKVLTDTGLPFDISKKDECQQKLCNMATVAIKQPAAKNN